MGRLQTKIKEVSVAARGYRFDEHTRAKSTMIRMNAYHPLSCKSSGLESCCQSWMCILHNREFPLSRMRTASQHGFLFFREIGPCSNNWEKPGRTS